MGVYIEDQPDMTKEQWLVANAREIDITKTNRWTTDERFVVLIDNGAFTAAGVIYGQEEWDRFTRWHPDDHRPKRWFICSVEKLLTVLPSYYHETVKTGVMR